MVDSQIVIAFAVGEDKAVNVSRRSDALSVYYQSMCVAFASFRLYNSSVRRTLATNVAPPKDIRTLLDILQVEITLVPFVSKRTDDPSAKFSTSLYLVDVLRALPPGNVVIVDPDVICLGDIEGIVSGPSAVYEIDYPHTHRVNGLSRADAERAYELMGVARKEDLPAYIGGEIVVVTADDRAAFVAHLTDAFAWSAERLARGEEPAFFTEEHLLGYVDAKMPLSRLNGQIRRIWTSWSFVSVHEDDTNLKLWHLPAEKERGFMRAFQALFAPDDLDLRPETVERGLIKSFRMGRTNYWRTRRGFGQFTSFITKKAHHAAEIYR